MDIRQLRYFLAVAESGTVSRAARRARVAQPSLSQQILRLETSLGVTLFDRTSRGMVLTDAGRALLPRARRIVGEVDEVRETLAGGVGQGAGSLTVGAIPTMAPYLLPGVMARLRTEFPACQIGLREDLTEGLLEALDDHEIDVAVVSTPVEHDRIEVEVLGSERLLVAVPRGHALAEAEGLSLADLRRAPIIALHEMHCLGGQIQRFCSSRRIGSNLVCRTTQLATVVELVRTGMGVSLVPEMAAGHEGDGLRYLPFRRETPRREIALAWKEGRSRSVVARRLAELLRERIE